MPRPRGKAGEGRGRQPLLGGREQYATKTVPGRCAAARPCAPRQSRGVLLVPAGDRIAFAGGGFSLVFQRLQPPLPEMPPAAVRFVSYSGKSSRNQTEAAASAGARAHLRRVPVGSCAPSPAPGPTPTAAPRGSRALPEPGTRGPSPATSPGAARSSAGTAPGPPCPAPGSFSPRSCCRAAGTGRGLAGRCQLPSSSYQLGGFVSPSGLGKVLFCVQGLRCSCGCSFKTAPILEG